MENQKKSFKYSSKGIWTFIVVISLLAIVGNFFSFLKPLNKNSEISYFNSEFQDHIRNSLYEQELYSNLYSGRPVKCFVRSYKISNYPFTEEYKNLYPKSIVGRDNTTGDIRYFKDFEEFNFKRKDLSNKGNWTFNTEINEEPIYKTNYLTNDMTRKMSGEFDPQTINEKEIFPNSDKVIAVKGFYENNNLKFTDFIKINNENEREQIYLTALKNSIERTYSTFTGESGIKKINFCYMIDLNSADFKSIVNSYEISTLAAPTMLVNSIIALLVIIFIAAASNYNRAKEVGFYKGISRFPIEIVIVLTIILFSPILLAVEFTGRGPENIKIYIYYLFQWIMIFFASISIFYFMFAIKSLFNEGINSFVVNNSIVVRFIRATKNFIIEQSEKLDISNSKAVIAVYGALLLLGIIGAKIVVHRNVRTLIILLWIGLITGIFAVLKNYILNLQELSENSKKIAEGDYSLKIDENKNNFKTLAHSLNTIGDNLNSAVDKAVKSERLKTELITNVSHDLKTPLTSIINYSELIVDEKTDEKNRVEYAKIINEKSHKLKTLIEDLFEVSKLNNNNIDLNLEKIDFKQLIEQVIGEWQDKLLEKNLNLNLNFPEDSIILSLDGNKTSRILDNLFSNIYKYALENTRVYIDLVKAEKTVLTIKNISKYPLNINSDEILERFMRGDSSRNTEGSGLGLSIASSLTNAQKGEFKVKIDGDLFKTIIEF